MDCPDELIALKLEEEKLHRFQGKTARI